MLPDGTYITFAGEPTQYAPWPEPEHLANRRFLDAARTDLPDALARIEELTGLLRRARRVIGTAEGLMISHGWCFDALAAANINAALAGWAEAGQSC